MTFFWVVISIVGLLMWVFSMLAAFLMGHAFYAKQQMQFKEAVFNRFIEWADNTFGGKNE